VLSRSGRWVLYYTARDRTSGFQCVSRAVASHPEGPYVDDSTTPFVCDRTMCGAIDPSPFVDDDGHAYLLWKSDENDMRCRRPSRLWSQPLTADGLALVCTPAPLLAVDRSWEGPLIEAPAMLRHHDRYLLFYSANWYESADYAIGYATCVSPAGPCTKSSGDHALVQSSKALLGPGGQEFFNDETGATWMAYHAWPAPNATYASGGARALRVTRLHFAGDDPTL
jgi:beta-xylosidase